MPCRKVCRNRAPLTAVADAKSVDTLRLDSTVLLSESAAATLTCHERVLWVGEFVEETKGTKSPHYLLDRTGQGRSAWVSGYKLNQDDAIERAAAGDSGVLTPDFVLSVRDQLQGLAFERSQIVLSTSYGRDKRSRLTWFKCPTMSSTSKPDTVATASTGAKVPVWFLDPENRAEDLDYPPMSEGIAVVGTSLGVICESGAQKYQKGGKGPLDYVVFLR